MIAIFTFLICLFYLTDTGTYEHEIEYLGEEDYEDE